MKQKDEINKEMKELEEDALIDDIAEQEIKFLKRNKW